MKRLSLFIGLLLCLAVAACNSFLAPFMDGVSQPVERIRNNPNATATLTPFMPILPTIAPTAEPESTATPDLQNQIEYSTTPTAWQEGIEIPPEQVSILVLGSDWRPKSGYRTDVIQFVVLRPDSHSANIVSFPRDLYLDIPGVGPERINTAFEIGGFKLMQSTFMHNFGLMPEHYVMTDFKGFIEIIDTLGGIDVDVEKELTDKCDHPDAVKGYCTASPGINTMDGAKALWYVRSRYSSSDFDRGRRSQEVIGGIVKKLLSVQVLTKAPELYKILSEYVETDMTPGQILALVPVLNGITQPDHVRRYSIGPSQGTPYIDPDTGNWVFLPNLVSIQNILQQAMYFP